MGLQVPLPGTVHEGGWMLAQSWGDFMGMAELLQIQIGDPACDTGPQLLLIWKPQQTQTALP